MAQTAHTGPRPVPVAPRLSLPCARPRLCSSHIWDSRLCHVAGRRCRAAPKLPVPQEELENFALPTVRHCQTVLNQLRYPSVLLLVCQDSEQSRPDVHFFHCDEVEVSRAAGRAPRPEPA